LSGIARQFHVNTELVVCEILRQDGSACEPEVSQVVLTGLHNYVGFFIRYNTGDLAMAAAGDCTCGRGFPVVVTDRRTFPGMLAHPFRKDDQPGRFGSLSFCVSRPSGVSARLPSASGEFRPVFLLIVPADSWSSAAQTRLRDAWLSSSATTSRCRWRLCLRFPREERKASDYKDS
jgi:hypothetical protein